jgi:hypothetical protein
MVFLTGARRRVGGPFRCSALRWCLKKDTSLVVVSMRSIWPNLSYIVIEASPVVRRRPGLHPSLGLRLARPIGEEIFNRCAGLPSHQLSAQRLRG